MTIFLLSCSPNTQHTIQKLPSGKEIKLISVGKMHFSNDDPALTLKYQTDINIDNIDLLRREAKEIWPVFRVDVEKSGLTSAVITAISQPTTKLLFFSSSRSFTFVVTMKDNGTWDFKTWGQDYNSASKILAEQHLNNIVVNDMVEAAKTLHLPVYFTPSERKDEITGLSKALQIIIDELGTIDTYTASESADTYRVIYLYSATPDFWDKHPTFNYLIYDVNYSKKGKGYIIFSFSIIEDKHVINSVRYGLSESNPESEAIFKKIETRVMQELKIT